MRGIVTDTSACGLRHLTVAVSVTFLMDNNVSRNMKIVDEASAAYLTGTVHKSI